MSALDIKAIGPILKKIYSDQKKKESDYHKKQRFQKIRATLGRKATKHNK
jgi:hypothetical protein